MSFPVVNGSNLRREKITLPQDFEGQFNLTFIAFQQWQQEEVNSWIPLAENLEEQFPGLVYYELPTIRSLGTFSRFFINEGMRAGIPSQKSRERTITLYLDKDEFRSTLSMEDENHIYILLLNKQGEEFWRERGSYKPEKQTELLAVLHHVSPPAGY